MLRGNVKREDGGVKRWDKGTQDEAWERGRS